MESFELTPSVTMDRKAESTGMWLVHLLPFCGGFVKLHYSFTDPLDDLNDLAVAEQFKSV